MSSECPFLRHSRRRRPSRLLIIDHQTIDHARLTDQGDHLHPRLTLRADEDICDEGMPHQLSPQIPIRPTPLANRDRISPRLPLSGLCDTLLELRSRGKDSMISGDVLPRSGDQGRQTLHQVASLKEDPSRSISPRPLKRVIKAPITHRD